MLKKLIRTLSVLIRKASYNTQELIELHGGKIGSGVFIGDDVFIDFDFCFLLEIGDGAVISAKSIIELHDSSLPNVLGNGQNRIGKIKIGTRAYIGVNSVILPGIEIGEGAIVGACSLVNRSIPARQVWGGVPADYICTVDEMAEKREINLNPRIADFDWLGEIEKQKVNYPKIKAKLIQKARVHFYESENKNFI